MYVTVGLYVYIYCIEIVAINQLLPISSHFGKKKNHLVACPQRGAQVLSSGGAMVTGSSGAKPRCFAQIKTDFHGKSGDLMGF